MAFSDNIADYIGTFSDNTAMSNWLTSGAKRIIDLLPVEKAEKFSTNLTDSGSGVTITGYRVLRAHKSGYGAKEVSGDMKTRVTPGGGLGTVAIVSGGTGYSVSNVLTLSGGTGGTVTVTSVSAGVVTGIEITTSGSGYSLGVSTTTGGGGTGCTIYVIPTSGSLFEATSKFPVYYTENGKLYILPAGGTGIGVAYPTVLYTESAISGFPQEFENAVILFASIQCGIQLLSSKTTALEAISLTSVDVITPPAVPSIAFSDASAVSTSAVTLSALTTAPTYTKPTLSMTAAPTISDLLIKAVPPASPSAPSFTYTSATSATIGDTTIGTIPTAPIYVPPVFGGSYTNTDTALTNTDIELATGHLQKVTAQLTEYRNKIDDSVQSFNSEREKFNADVTKLVEQARLTQQKLIAQAQSNTSTDIQNQAQVLVKQVQEYEAKLNKFAHENNVYSNQINQEINEYRANLDKEFQLWQTKRNTELQEYNLNIQNELNEFNKELQIYITDFQHKVKQSELDIAKSLEDAKNSNDIALQNKIQNLQGQLIQYDSTIKKYLGDLESYGTQVNQVIQKYNTQVQQKHIEFETLERKIKLMQDEYKLYLNLLGVN